MKLKGTQLDMNAQRIVNMADGTSATDAVTKQQMDGVIRGLDWKAEVIAASTGNISVAAPGSSIDGVTITAGMQVLPVLGTVTRILLKDQTTPAENGIWDWNGAAVPMTRSTDADSGTELSGSTVTVQRGTTNADRVYRVTTDDAIVVGTTAVTWAQVGAGGTTYTAGAGLTLTSTTFDVVGGTGITVAADLVSVDTAVVVRKYAANVGNGSLTTLPVNHALNSTDVTVSVKEVSSGELVFPDVVIVDANNLNLIFGGAAPASNSYRVTVHA